MKDLRKNERIKAVTFTTVYNRRGHTLLGFLGDITPQGAMVVGEKLLQIDQDIDLDIEFRGVTEIPGGRLSLPAHIAWSKQDEDTKYFHTGFEFLSVSEASKKAIELVVQRYKFDLNFPA